jgi:hypothetical protein
MIESLREEAPEKSYFPLPKEAQPELVGEGD